ncbi:MAG: hypothetical protein ABSD56_01560 [Bryobacteraceae bacterium]|jgi:hypothetical protein
MNVRFTGYYWMCECGSSMLYLDSVENAPRRHMTCQRMGCPHFGEVFLEPVFVAERLGAKPEQD